ncbi:hypothetical protein FCL40_00875 [Ferrimonas sediminicola]|uniref:Type IV pilus biogenesis protein PilP n=1 Tax=Ferrimonas sediminicola TaxID=2569538 RepID=A0A4V5NYR9_9GAMM|nr:hypothetical protein [Ferrimonas sediminicola]TKB51141.1 hypothetical protein FCL40_00875 [Ferrimonas sediminicola]
MLKTAVLTLMLAPAAVSAADAACRAIDDQRQRLACYDKAAEAVVHCAAHKDRLDRLLCFDGLAKPAAAVPAQAPAAAPATTDQRFGLNNERPEEPEAISQAISKMKTDPYGKFIVTLENGQVWKQIDSRRFRLDQGVPVTIRKASLGSFILSQSDGSKSARVKRVQ